MATTIRLDGGPLHGKEVDVPVEDGQDELRLIVSTDADAQIGLDTPEQVYRRVDSGTFAFVRTGTVRERAPTKPPGRLTGPLDRGLTRITTLLWSLGSMLAPRVRIASLGQLLLLLLTPYVSTLSLEGLPRYTALIAVGLLLVLLGLPALALFELKDRGLRVTRWDQGLGIFSLTLAIVGATVAGVALNVP